MRIWKCIDGRDMDEDGNWAQGIGWKPYCEHIDLYDEWCTKRQTTCNAIECEVYEKSDMDKVRERLEDIKFKLEAVDISSWYIGECEDRLSILRGDDNNG